MHIYMARYYSIGGSVFGKNNRGPLIGITVVEISNHRFGDRTPSGQRQKIFAPFKIGCFSQSIIDLISSIADNIISPRLECIINTKNCSTAAK